MPDTTPPKPGLLRRGVTPEQRYSGRVLGVTLVTISLVLVPVAYFALDGMVRWVAIVVALVDVVLGLILLIANRERRPGSLEKS